METLRLTGLASGLDTQSIVETTLRAERIPAVRLEQEALLEQDKVAAFNDIDLAVTDLRSHAVRLNSFLTWGQMNASSSDDDKLTASAGFSANASTYSVNVSQLAESHMIASDAQASATAALSISGDFTLGGESVTVDGTDSLEDIRDKINNAAVNMDDNERVAATIISSTLVIERSETGNTDITISDGANNVLQSLGVFDSGSAIKNELQASEDLSATVNSVAVASSANTGLSDVISGLTMNFHETGSTTLKVDNDSDTIKSIITEFIESYNSAMELIEQSNNVELSTGSGDQSEISNVGLLQGENILGGILSRSRSVITSSESDPGVLDSAFNNLEKIGIWTEGRENRLAIVDEDLLDQALATNFEEVEELFRDNEGGMIRKFQNYLDSLVDPIDGSIVRRTQTLEVSIQDKLDQIDLIDDRLAQREIDLFAQFARMEEAIAQINSQSGFIVNAVGG